MADRDASETIQRSPMERFARAYSEALLHTRTEIQLQPAGSNRRYNVEVIGVHDGSRMVIVSAPANSDRSLIAVHQGQIVTCRWMNASTVFRFEAVIARLVFDPLPMLHLNELHAIQFRELRSVPRARSAIASALRTPVPMAALVTDLSVRGPASERPPPCRWTSGRTSNSRCGYRCSIATSR